MTKTSQAIALLIGRPEHSTGALRLSTWLPELQGQMVIIWGWKPWGFRNLPQHGVLLPRQQGLRYARRKLPRPVPFLSQNAIWHPKARSLHGCVDRSSTEHCPPPAPKWQFPCSRTGHVLRPGTASPLSSGSALCVRQTAAGGVTSWLGTLHKETAGYHVA